jgi:hypothetical protein
MACFPAAFLDILNKAEPSLKYQKQGRKTGSHFITWIEQCFSIQWAGNKCFLHRFYYVYAVKHVRVLSIEI